MEIKGIEVKLSVVLSYLLVGVVGCIVCLAGL